MARALIALAFVASASPQPAPTCSPRPEWATLGEPRPFPAPDAAAVEANAEGKRLYRQRRWDEARAAYRAALARDGSYLGPQLNVACSFVRQERWDDALREVTALLARAYVPWAREVREAADLSALRPRKEWAAVEQAAAGAASRWGAAALEGIVYLARSKPPLGLAGEGVFLLGLRQELVAYVPATGRHLQLTAEDGRVLAFVRSSDGRHLAYVVGGKLVRDATGPSRLRELALRTLELPSMQLGALVPIEGDVTSLALSLTGAGEVRVDVRRGREPGRTFTFDGRALAPAPARTDPHEPVWLDAAGARAATKVRRGPCGHALAQAPASVPGLILRRPGAAAVPLDAPFGAALAGLPFPDARP